MRAVLFNRIVIILALAGIVIAGTLTYAKLAGIVPPCGVSGGCEKVQNHPSSVWFGIPVSVLGLAAYVAILGIALVRVFKGLEQTRKLGFLGYWITLVGAIVSLGLQIYSGTVIKAWCMWCIASAATMIVLFIIQAALYQAESDAKPTEPPAEPTPSARKKGDFAVIGIAVLLSIVAMVAAKKMTDDKGSGESFVMAQSDVPKLVPDDAHSKGPADAPITIVEFGDLCCAACQKAYGDVTSLYQKYDGKIRVVFRHFPLVTVHQQAYRAAVYSEYAASKGHFWEYIDRVYQSTPEQAEKKETFENVLLELNMNVADAEKSYQSDSSAAYERVYRDLQMADQLGIQVTPTFFVFAKGERPYSVSMSKLVETIEENEKYKKLLGK